MVDPVERIHIQFKIMLTKQTNERTKANEQKKIRNSFNLFSFFPSRFLYSFEGYKNAVKNIRKHSARTKFLVYKTTNVDVEYDDCKKGSKNKIVLNQSHLI